ncbi:accessory gene regulator ArgB-like protein [Acetonema longum]|uniref:Accessory gene regulator B n=1 Tax=Acetonema longum DSM 6540 TaxID=1009370 RepID=F7NLA3_9FIRM|nr:accessory gene regulator B family protein [Acetonema longum]EGO63208.1 Accessory gene regulator B [Acetonema longum DSM 6540]
MDILKDTAVCVARYLSEKTGLDSKETDTVRFVMEYLLGFFVNLGGVIGIALALGTVPYVLAAMLTALLLRLVSGGSHCSTALRCFVLGTVALVSIGQLAALLGRQAPPALLAALMIFSVAAGFYAVNKWAPGDTPAKPIVSAKKREKYKRFSFLFIIAWAAAVSLGLIFSGRNTPLAAALIAASIGGFWWQIFSITPAGYRFAAAMERVFDSCCITFRTKKQQM